MDQTNHMDNIKSLPHESYRDRKPVSISPDTRTAEERAQAMADAEAALDARFSK